ncbi:HelD family protein [Hamadaea tsunoensis]|uniref:HelD family protein n=1 Tax=Hamadaea tsunoensis TaxID=53368 RepID=UPI000403CC2D|nr:UvrD-helicase domain-containing protein [Hamadaea tsunoensis]
MESKAAEIVAEQAYFDRAHQAQEDSRTALGEAAAAAGNAAAARHLRTQGQAHADRLGGPGDAVAFGRIDFEDKDLTLYVGHALISQGGETLVVSWKAPAAQPYYQAGPKEPLGLARKRTFTCTGNVIDDFADVDFRTLVELLEGPDAALLRDLAQGRTGRMRDIVATIQAAQYDIIQAALNRLLVVEGGPGTGKTAVALHRASWLLANHDGLAGADILVVGPHPTFTHYIRDVLPGLGDDDVRQLDVTRLAPDRLRRGRTEDPETARLKGDVRMAGFLRRALQARIGSPEPAERLQIDGRYVTLPGADLADAITACRTLDAPYADRRARLRVLVTDLAAARLGGLPAGRHAALDNLVERLWPQQTPASFLQNLLGSRDRLSAAAGDELTAAEATLLRRRGADRLTDEIWSRDDLPLLDELDELINGVRERFRHIIVDEAQDLSPMQLRSVARRSSTGSITVLGDLAQSTGAWARDTWDNVLAYLPDSQPREIVTLRYGYRVPRPIYEYAARLLPIAAPGLVAPEVVRDGPAEPGIHRVEPAERAGRAVDLALQHTDAGRLVGIVCPPGLRTQLEAALAANGLRWSSADRGELGEAINLVSPTETKGLEFDTVIVVEPEDIVAGDRRGHRLLYVALTRATAYLEIVCTGSPLPFGPVQLRPEGSGGTKPVAVPGVAEAVADRLRAQVPPDQWHSVLAEVQALLGVSGADGP